MSNVKPPARYAGTPAVTKLAAGTSLFRVHKKRFKADAFNPGSSHRYYGGGRFDGTEDDPYPFLYAGSTVNAAVAETLLRDLPLHDTGVRQLPLIRVAGRRISSIEVTTDLELVSLCSGPDLGRVSQDPWLTTCDTRDYAQSRHWGHWIRDKAKTAMGYVWVSRRDPALLAYVLFADRIPPRAIVISADPQVPPGDEADFDTPLGQSALRTRLTAYNVCLALRKRTSP